jgi:hypothetical protein
LLLDGKSLRDGCRLPAFSVRSRFPHLTSSAYGLNQIRGARTLQWNLFVTSKITAEIVEIEQWRRASALSDISFQLLNRSFSFFASGVNNEFSTINTH